jgi:hypothetical protein
MKSILVIISVAAVFGWVACNTAGSRYVDVETGKTVKLEKGDDGLMVNAETKKPVRIYVDTRTHDTIYGKTGRVINGHIVRNGNEADGYSYRYDEEIKSDGDGEYKVKGSDYKIKVEKDGDLKIKDGDMKTKIDGETGESKHKND